jgi:hypothetical protein
MVVAKFQEHASNRKHRISADAVMVTRAHRPNVQVQECKCKCKCQSSPLTQRQHLLSFWFRLRLLIQQVGDVGPTAHV